MNEMNNQKIFGTKEYLREKLEGLKNIYVVYLNDTGSKILLYYVDKDSGMLERVWISPPTDKRKKFNDKPGAWQMSGLSQSYKYCFVCGGGGYSKKDYAVESLWRWLELDYIDAPRTEVLN